MKFYVQAFLQIILVITLALWLPGCDRKQPAQTKSCPSNKPYYPLCTHASHNSTTWLGECHETWESALKSADEHVAQSHPGEKRWTGVKKVR